MSYLLFVEVDSLSILYVIRAGRGQCILVVVDMIMIAAIYKVWLFQNLVL
jgi:hypothetical protein